MVLKVRKRHVHDTNKARICSMHYIQIDVLFIVSEEAEEGEWPIEDVRKKFQINNGEHLWRTSFKEGVDLDENILERISDCESTPEEYVDYAAKFDLAFLTPHGNQIRFKVRPPLNAFNMFV